MARLGTKNRNYNGESKIVFLLEKCSCSGSIEFTWNPSGSNGMGGCLGSWSTVESCTCPEAGCHPVPPVPIDSCEVITTFAACIGA